MYFSFQERPLGTAIWFSGEHVCQGPAQEVCNLYLVSTDKNIRSFHGLLNIQSHIRRETVPGTPSEQTLSKREEKILVEINIDEKTETSTFHESNGKNLHFSYLLLCQISLRLI